MGRAFGPPSIDSEIANWSQYGSRPQDGVMGGLMQTGDTQDTMGSLRRKYGGNSSADTLAGLAAGLIQASSPSPVPRSFVDILATGIGHGAQANIGSEDKILKRMMLGSQLETAQQKLKQQEAFQKILQGVGPTAPAAGATPAEPAPGPMQPGSAPNPLNIGNVRPVGASTGFQQPQTLDEGVKIAVDNVRAYQKQTGQPLTLMQVAQKWAPAGDGQNNPAVWAQNVSQIGGLDPKQPLDFNDPQTALKFARGVHGAEWGQAALKPPEAYLPGVHAAMQPPVQLAQAGGAPVPPPLPQTVGGSAPVQAGPPVAAQGAPQGAPLPAGMPQGPVPSMQTPEPPPGSQTLQDVVQKIPMGVRQLLGAMDIKEGLPVLMKYAEPNHQVAMDTRTGQVIFADKNDIGRLPYLVPVDAAKLQLEQQKAAAETRQAAAREEANRIRGANEPLQPGAGPGLPPTPTPGFAEQKGAVTGAEESAKVAPALAKYQGELAIKDHQLAQTGAEHARVGIANLDRLGKLLDQVNTNKFQGTVQDLKASAKALGVDLDAMGVGDNVGVAQAAKALSQQMALQLRDPAGGGGMPGSLSDADRQFLTTMVPAITNDPNANHLMIDWQKKVHQRTIEVAKIVNDYVRTPEFTKDPAAVYAKVADYANSHPLFDPQRDSPKNSATGTVPASNAPLDNQGTVNTIDQILQERRKK